MQQGISVHPTRLFPAFFGRKRLLFLKTLLYSTDQEVKPGQVDCTTDIPELGQGVNLPAIEAWAADWKQKRNHLTTEPYFLSMTCLGFWVVQMAGGHGRFPKIPLSLADRQIHWVDSLETILNSVQSSRSKLDLRTSPSINRTLQMMNRQTNRFLAPLILPHPFEL